MSVINIHNFWAVFDKCQAEVQAEMLVKNRVTVLHPMEYTVENRFDAAMRLIESALKEIETLGAKKPQLLETRVGAIRELSGAMHQVVRSTRPRGFSFLSHEGRAP